MLKSCLDLPFSFDAILPAVLRWKGLQQMTCVSQFVHAQLLVPLPSGFQLDPEQCACFFTVYAHFKQY